MNYQIEAAVCSNVGKIRKTNEDNFYLHGQYMDEAQRDQGAFLQSDSSDQTQIYAVCDGIGGEEAGEDASLAAVKFLKEYESAKSAADSGNIKKGLQEASDRIEKEARKKNARSGTTIAMLLIHQNTVRTAHLGDSRVYLWEKGQLRQITKDHSEVQYMYDMGMIKKEDMKSYPRRHVITKYLGMSHEEALLSPSISSAELLHPGAWYLICSDGLTDMVDDAAISRILSDAENPSSAVRALVQAALEKGGVDNVTVLCAAVRGTEVKEQDMLAQTADPPVKAASPVPDESSLPMAAKARKNKLVILCFVGSILVLGAALFLFLKDRIF